MKPGKLSEFSEKIFGDRRILIFLFFANLAGFFAGMYYYRNQLAESSPALWVVIIDSPLSVLLFAVVCVLFYFRKRIPEALKFLASAYAIKYGLWTMLTIWLYWGNYASSPDPFDPAIGIINFFLHFGMIIEGIVLVPKIRPKISDALFVLLLCLANDYFDYFLGTVTRIPSDYLNLLMLESIASSLLITFSIAFVRFQRPRRRARSRKAAGALD
jgi:uncharacterized membrane protein YpjA